MPEPEITTDGLAGLIAAAALALGAVAEYLRRKLRNGKPKAPTQLDRIEAALADLKEPLALLVRTLVVEIEGGGKVSTSRKLADRLSEEITRRFDAIEDKLAKRPPRPADERIAALARNVEFLSDAVQSGMETLRKQIAERK